MSAHLRDYLLDIVKHTHGLGVVDLVRIIGDEDKTKLDALATDRSVVVEATFHQPIAEFVGTFGMSNLNKLNTILNIPEYKEDAQISLLRQARNGKEVPSGLHFENKAGDFKNDFRFMSAEIINEKLKTVTFNGARWSVTLQPSVASIQRLKFQAQANAEENVFTAKTNGSDLVFSFGDASTHAGEFIFQAGITGSLAHAWGYPVSVVSSILSLPGDTTMQFSDQGAAKITVDSGLATYDFILPAQAK